MCLAAFADIQVPLCLNALQPGHNEFEKYFQIIAAAYTSASSLNFIFYNIIATVALLMALQ